MTRMSGKTLNLLSLLTLAPNIYPAWEPVTWGKNTHTHTQKKTHKLPCFFSRFFFFSFLVLHLPFFNCPSRPHAASEKPRRAPGAGHSAGGKLGASGTLRQAKLESSSKDLARLTRKDTTWRSVGFGRRITPLDLFSEVGISWYQLCSVYFRHEKPSRSLPIGWMPPKRNTKTQTGPRSSSREDRIGWYPICFLSILVGEPSLAQERGEKGHLAGGPSPNTTPRSSGGFVRRSTLSLPIEWMPQNKQKNSNWSFTPRVGLPKSKPSPR